MAKKEAKPKKEESQPKEQTRKEFLREKLIEAVLEKDGYRNFNAEQYLQGQGLTGLLRERLGYHDPRDKSFMQEILLEMEKAGEVRYIGGTIWRLIQK